VSSPAVPPSATAPTKTPTTNEPRSDETRAPTCEREGDYRFAINANGSQWWLRFAVEGDEAELLEPVEVLGLDAGALVLDPVDEDDPCHVVVRATGPVVGELTLELDLNPADPTSSDPKIGGVLTRTKVVSEGDERHEVLGVHDHDPPAVPTCVTPGVYRVELGAAAEWRLEVPDDALDCEFSTEAASPIYLRVERFGGVPMVTLLQEAQLNSPAFVPLAFDTDGDCAIGFKLSDGQTALEAYLSFTPGELSGVAGRVEYEVVEDGEEGRGIWTCVADGVLLHGSRVG